MNAMDRPCSVAHCEAAALHAGLMCPEHWALLPPEATAAVLQAWEAFQQHGAGGGRWVAYNTICRVATAVFAADRPLPEAWRSQYLPVGRVRTSAGSG